MEAASALDPAIGFLLVMPSDGGRARHPNAPLAPYFSLWLNSSHSTLQGRDKLHLSTEDTQSSKPQRQLKE